MSVCGDGGVVRHTSVSRSVWIETFDKMEARLFSEQVTDIKNASKNISVWIAL